MFARDVRDRALVRIHVFVEPACSIKSTTAPASVG